ncbi:MAG: glycosyltransferase [Anaerolineales bacterium]
MLTSVYRGEEHLRSFFDELNAQTIFPELELVLVLNEPSSKETQFASHFASQYPEAVQVLTVPRLETLGASWNRAWRAARAPYLALWNVDDRRVVDSLQRQLAALEQDLDAMLCYGDYVSVAGYGKEDGVRRQTPSYQVDHFRRSFAQGGAFWLFRHEVEAQIGNFDEQFRVGADMEYSFRMAAKGLVMIRCNGLLGFFTDAAQGLSTREGAKESAVEATAIQLRYGVFDKVRREYLDKARMMRTDAIKNADEWIPLVNFLPQHANYINARKLLWVVGSVRNAVRGGLQKIGMLSLLHKLQAKYLKRDV